MEAVRIPQFREKVFVSGNIRAMTGLHIGGSSTEMAIGGIDPVVRDPFTNEPYIPGSSLRGKIRSLMERAHDEMSIEIKMKNTEKPKFFHKIADIEGEDFTRIQKDGISAGPASSPESGCARLFGVAVDKQKDLVVPIPQRLVVRDAKLEKNSAQRLLEARNAVMPYTEVKTEVAIDRITSTANLRDIERVPAGADFIFEMVLTLYDTDDAAEYLQLLFEGMELLQDDYLGGHGSRGYGRVDLCVSSVSRKTAEDYVYGRPASEVKDVRIPVSLKRDEEEDQEGQ